MMLGLELWVLSIGWRVLNVECWVLGCQSHCRHEMSNDVIDGSRGHRKQAMSARWAPNAVACEALRNPLGALQTLASEHCFICRTQAEHCNMSHVRTEDKLGHT